MYLTSQALFYKISVQDLQIELASDAYFINI